MHQLPCKNLLRIFRFLSLFCLDLIHCRGMTTAHSLPGAADNVCFPTLARWYAVPSTYPLLWRGNVCHWVDFYCRRVGFSGSVGEPAPKHLRGVPAPVCRGDGPRRGWWCCCG